MADTNPLADRIGIGPVTLRRGLINDDDWRRVLIILFGEGAPYLQRHSHQAEIIGGDKGNIGEWRLARFRFRLAFKDEGGNRPPANEWHPGGNAHRLHAW